MDDANGEYNAIEAWNRPTQVYNAPTGTWEDNLLRQAQIVITMDRAAVQAVVRCPLPQVLPPDTVLRHPTVLSIEDVLGAVSRNVEDNRTHFSGGPAGYSASPQNVLGGNI